MVFGSSNGAYKTDLSHKQIILQQILICNKIFSGFEATPTVINPQAGFYDFTQQAHSGKAILLAVLILEANTRPILPEEYQVRTIEIKKHIDTPIDKKYKNAMGQDQHYYGLKIIAPDPTTQLEGIIDVFNLYQELLAAIYSLPKFSDAIGIHQIATGEDITEKEIGELESVEFNTSE